MLKLILRGFLPLMLLLALPARGDWIEQSNAYAMRVMEAGAQFDPETASSNGLDQFDTQISDLTPGNYERRLTHYQSTLKQLQGALAQEKEPRVRQDLQILIDSVTQTKRTLELNREYLLPYSNVHAFLFSSFNSLLDPRNDASRYPAALERLRKYNGRADGFQPYTELAKAETMARFNDKKLLGPFIGQLENNLASAPHLSGGLRPLFERAGLTGYESDLDLLEQQLLSYAQWLEKEMLPRARKENLLPPALYVNNLRGFGVYATPEELIAQGQYSYQLIRSEMKSLALRIAAQRGWEDGDLVSVMRALKQEQVPQDKLLDLYKQRLAEIEAIIRREDLVTLPEREASIRVATEAESAQTPASFMSPPQLLNNTGQFGEFVLVQSNPAMGEGSVMDDWSHDAITWALTVHEARPGHELQFARLVEDGTSVARALFAFNSANAEGWGLYAESIMQEFLPLEGQLFNLFTRQMRAARMFLDPMVNTGQLSHQDVVDFLTEQVALSLPMASSEADRYTFRAPGQATSYYYGYTSLMALRTEAEVALGDSFDQRAFHDFILKQGLLPPNLLRDAVRDEFLSQ